MPQLAVQTWAEAAAFSPTGVQAELRGGSRPHQEWSNGPHTRYTEHTHPFEKLLICLEGSLVFYVPGQRALELRPGDRLVLPAGTRHAVRVGPQGVRCVEIRR